MFFFTLLQCLTTLFSYFLYTFGIHLNFLYNSILLCLFIYFRCIYFLDVHLSITHVSHSSFTAFTLTLTASSSGVFTSFTLHSTFAKVFITYFHYILCNELWAVAWNELASPPSLRRRLLPSTLHYIPVLWRLTRRNLPAPRSLAGECFREQLITAPSNAEALC